MMKYWIICILCHSFILVNAQSICRMVNETKINSLVLLPSAKQKSFIETFDFGSAYTKSLFTTTSLIQLPAANYLPSLFCKLEYKLEAKSKLAPRFRLGTLQYANWMEGKGDYYSRF